MEHRRDGRQWQGCGVRENVAPSVSFPQDAGLLIEGVAEKGNWTPFRFPSSRHYRAVKLRRDLVDREGGGVGGGLSGQVVS